MQPDLRQLINIIQDTPAYHQLVNELKQRIGDIGTIVMEAAKPYLISALQGSLQLPVLVITSQPENCKKLHEQISTWLGYSNVKIFVEPDALPYERIASDVSTELERVNILSTLADFPSERPGVSPPLIVASVPALVSKTPLYSDFMSTKHIVMQDMDYEPFQLLRRWEAMGYRMDSVVEVPGTISHRGGIVDIFPPTSGMPARIEFFGNTVDTIRLFDPVTQRSVETVTSLAVGLATEMLMPLLKDEAGLEGLLDKLDFSGCSDEVAQQFRHEMSMLKDRQNLQNLPFYSSLFNTDSILSYLPEDTLLILDEPLIIEQTVNEFDAEAGQMRSEALERGELPRNFPRPYFTWEEIQQQLGKKKCLILNSWGTGERQLDFTTAPGYAAQPLSFAGKTRQLLDEGNRVIVVSHQASRLAEMLDEEDIIATPVNEVKQAPPPGSLILVQGSLAEGWVMNNDTYLLTDAEIFGFAKQRRLTKKRPVPRHKLFVDITPGDYVVHIEHGIARFADVVMLRTTGSEKEYLVLQYAAGDKLYVPTDQIDRVNRYIGAGDRPPTLSRLSTQEWTRTKQRAKEAAEDMAQELLALYASREVVSGFAFSRDTVWQQELEASFPYVETPDQLEAQREVKEDMEKTRPMDRLVCGDVGYGKTEVAVRAVFKAVIDNRQAAVLVPTTVLAEQHFLTFKQRFEAFPLRVEVLSRFKSAREQDEILAGLADGTVDVCIGTHRLLQKDVSFKDLGLLVIDEEQRFGVAHKEYLKQKRQEVDVLTLSATPIPRTLHMSLVGVRDMSTMETPPEERLPIKTYVAEYNERLIREAIIRELERNGQVFFVHNRVQSIAMIAASLRSLIPEARIAIAHGQMHGDELEKVMSAFARGESDVLVCSTIIESGLDMPNVNTMIINQADKFGLTQLYQLRGRVGRGGNLAYSYFLYDGGKKLTPTAQKRLRTIFEATELGAGFNIALKDLEIRGAGTLLGARQSGHITAVGFSLYCRLLAEAVEARKAKIAGVKEVVSPPLPTPVIDLPLPAYIPEEYVADLNTRLAIYQKLAKLDSPEQIGETAGEFADRFGALPEEVKNLLYALRIKFMAAAAGIESVTTEDSHVVVRLFRGMQLNHYKFRNMLKDGIKVGVRQIALNPKRLGSKWQEVLEEVVGRVG